MARSFHPEVNKHSRALFMNGHRSHAAFDAAKVYNKKEGLAFG